MSFSLVERHRQSEWMDDPRADPQTLRKSLRFIRRVNRFLGYTRATLWHLRQFSSRWKPGEKITIADLGTGSADIPRAILRWADKRGFNVRIIGLDLHATTVAAAVAEAATDPRLKIIQGDVLAMPLAEGGFDYAVTNMFLHHLDDPQVVAVLRTMDRLSRRGIIFADLVRNKSAYWSVRASTILSNRMVRHDAAASVAQPLIAADRTTIQTDMTAVRTASEALATAKHAALTTAPVTAAQAALTAAKTTAQPLIQADLTAIQLVYKTDEPAIQADMHQLWVDTRSGALSTVIAADQAALAAAKATLAADLTAPQAQLQTDEAPVKAAEAALQAAINADPGIVAAQATLTADQADVTTAETQLQTDEAPVSAARAALQAAINADPGVTAAQATLTAAQAAVTAANTQFQTDLATYVADLKAGI